MSCRFRPSILSSILSICMIFVAAPAFSKPATKPVVAPVVAPAPAASAVDWTGFYAGLDLGGTWGNFYDGPSGTGGNISGGGFGGYNFQSDHFVFGGEADVSGIHVPAISPTSNFNEDWNMTFRARAGYAYEQFLPYVTLGFALTSTSWTLNGLGSASNVRPGLAMGAGVDALISGNWFARGEYLYTKVPTETLHVGATALKGGSENGTLRASIGYKF